MFSFALLFYTNFGVGIVPFIIDTQGFWPSGKPITVETTEHGKPLQLTFDGEIHTVELICNRWRDGGSWWKNESEREYIKLVTESGLLCVIAKDVGGDGDGWVMVRVYD